MPTAIIQIPEGPLHPDDAVFALVVGLLLGLALRTFGRSGSALLPVAAVLAFELRQPETVASALDGRLVPLLAGAAVVVAASLPLTLGGDELSARLVLLTAVPPLALVWGIVPDTEAAVIGGGVVLGTLGFGAARWDRRGALAVTVVPVFAALVGSVGRPSRLWPALAALLAATVVSGLVARGWLLRQRAGTPTTVDPAATSEVTTAPAPTTAS